MSTTSQPWWKSAVVYQIYPISFYDSNGDGFGDLNGIHSKLDYLKDLGADVIWLCPIYKSPLADMGYDIADYRSIDPRYGTLEDWDSLIKGVHDRGMKLIMDLVVNHTSEEHDWFTQSRSSKDDPKRDWYIWRPPKYDSDGNRQPPNNWRAIFQGSAWKWDEASGEYYLHLFLPEQPDLNWDNPSVREAVFDLMNFWLDRGCDGFRMDVINLISKTDGLPDAPIVDPGEFTQPASMHFANGPRVHQYIKEMNQKVLSRYNLMTVGEAPFSHTPEEMAEYVLPASKELNMIFQFELMDIDAAAPLEPMTWRKWQLADLEHVIQKWQSFDRAEGFWNSVYNENHDHSRSVSRYGNDSPEWRAVSAKLLALLQITQSGTLYVYQGQEIAMRNFPITWGIEEYKDAATINYWNKMLEQRKKKYPDKDEKDINMSDVLLECQRKARDHARTPVQWDSSASAGFTTGTPWMKVNDDYASTWNVADQLLDLASVHGFYKRALEIRKKSDVLTYGDFITVSNGHPQVFAYKRTRGADVVVVLLNFTKEEAEIEIEPSILAADKQFSLILSNYDTDPLGEPLRGGRKVSLRGFEGRVYNEIVLKN